MSDKCYKNDGYVVCWPDGEPYRPNYVSDMFTKLLKKLDFPRIRLHDLRHSFASIAHEKLDIYSIMHLLGHSDIRVTQKVYTHMFDKTMKQAVGVVADIINDEIDKETSKIIIDVPDFGIWCLHLFIQC